MVDEREFQSLSTGDKIYDKNDQWYEITGCPIGFGGTGVLYPVRTCDSELEYVLKECFPIGRGSCQYVRKNGDIVPMNESDEDAMRYLKECKKNFKKEYEIGEKFQGDNTIVPLKIICANKVEIGGRQHQGSKGIFLLMERKRGLFLKDIIDKAKTHGGMGQLFKSSDNVYITTKIMIEILKALDTIHKKNYLFGDIQEGNVYFGACKPECGDIGYCCLLDFGCVREVETYEDGILRTSLINTDTIYCTDGYGAPELYADDKKVRLDRSIDTYAIGRLMLYLLTGRKEKDTDFFYNSYEIEQIGCRKELLPSIDKILKKALNDQPENRYKEAKTMLEALKKLEKKSCPPKNNLSLVLPNLNDERFVGRRKELKRLEKEYMKKTPLIELWGLAGIGKTELAIEYAHRMNEKYGGNGYLVTFKDSMRDTIIGMATQFSGFQKENINGKIKTEEEIYQEVLGYLREFDRDDILIIDHVDANDKEYEMLIGKDREGKRDNTYQELREMNLRIIITTRKKRLDSSIKIDRMQERDLIKLVKQYAGQNIDEEEVKKLIHILDFHTLAIELVAKVLEQRKWSYPEINISMIMDRLANGESKQLTSCIEIKRNNAGKKFTFFEYIALIFDVAGLSDDGCRMMAESAFLPINGMEFKLFAETDSMFNQQQMNSLIEGGWLYVQEGKLFIHPLVREACCEQLYTERKNEVKKFVNNLRKQAIQITGCLKIEEMKQVSYYLLNVSKKMNSSKKRYIKEAADIFYIIGEYNEAKFLYEKILTQCSEKMQDLFIADVCTSLGGTYKYLGEYNKSLVCLSKALKLNKEYPLKRYSEIADSYSSIGVVYADLGKYNQSIKMHKRALKINNKKIQYYSNIVDALCKQNKCKEGIVYGRRALQMAEKMRRYSDKDIAYLYLNIGSCYGCIAYYKKAIKYEKKAAEILEKYFSQEYLAIAICYENIGSYYCESHSFEKGIEYEKKALGIRIKKLEKRHPDIANSYENIGMHYCDVSKYETALKYEKKALKIRKERFEENPLDVAQSYENIGKCYCDRNEYEVGLKYEKEALKIRKERFKENPLRIADNYQTIGEVYWQLKNYKKCFMFEEQALKIRKKRLKECFCDVADSYESLGNHYWELKKHEKSLRYLKKALNIDRKKLGKRNLNTKRDYEKIAQYYRELEQYTRSLRYETKLLEIIKKDKRSNVEDIYRSYIKILSDCKKLKRYNTGRKYYVEALKFFNKNIENYGVRIGLNAE